MTVREEFENDYFIDRMNHYTDLVFEWKGVAYFIDYTEVPFRPKSRYVKPTHRRISVFDLNVRSPIVETSCFYSMDINDMLDNHYIDGERLRDIIMNAECLDIY